MRSGSVLALALVAWSASACSSVPPPVVADAARLRAVRTAYLVASADKDRGTREAIQRAFERHGVRVTSGLEEHKPRDVDAYLRFSEIWRWDMKLYLQDLDIEVFDRETGARIAVGKFRNSYFHSFPDLDETASAVVDGMFAPVAAEPIGDL